MINLLLAILANVAIFSVFRILPRMRAVTLHAIVINYWVCVATGALYSRNSTAWSAVSFSAPWAPWTGVLSVIFIGTFLLMALTTQRVSMTVATIANKMSLAIPVLFSLLFLGLQSKGYDGWNYLGIALAFPAIALSSLPKRRDPGAEVRTLKKLWMPFAVFMLGGIIDSLINYVNLTYISEALSPVFTVVLFACTGTLGIIILLIRREFPSWRSWLGGIVLGVPNYFSIYFVLRSLTDFNNDGALLYPLLNLGVIMGSAILAAVAFRERLTRINLIGLLLAILAIVLLGYQELF